MGEAMIWQFLDTGAQSGSFNMKADEDMTREVGLCIRPSTLRLYGWEPRTISIGFNQEMGDFDRDKLAQDGIAIVRRPTGGRAIFHAHELTYSVAMLAGEKSPRQVYQLIHHALLQGVQILGIDALMSTHADDFRHLSTISDGVPCFTSSAKSEIHWHGKKLVGSAQRRFGNAILQHGSFLLGPEHRLLVNYLAMPHQPSGGAIEEELRDRTVEAESILERTVTYSEAAAAVKLGFETALGLAFVPGAPITTGSMVTS